EVFIRYRESNRMRFHGPRVAVVSLVALLGLSATPALAAPALAAPALAGPASPPLQPTNEDEVLPPVLPPVWEEASASAQQRAGGTPTLNLDDGERVAGTVTVVGMPTSEGEKIESLSVDGTQVPARENLGDGVSHLLVDIGSNALSMRFSNYLVVNGTRCSIFDTGADKTLRIEVPNELLVVGENTITLAAGARPAGCGLNYDDFTASGFRLAMGGGVELTDTSNPTSISLGDGTCGSNPDQPLSVDLSFTIDADTAAHGLLHVLDTTELTDGEHSISVTTDAGASLEHSIVVDNTGPELVSTTPRDGEVLLGEAAVAARVRDDAGVRSGPEMTLDGEPIENGQTISSDVLAAGEHELIVEAEDDLGNTAR